MAGMTYSKAAAEAIKGALAETKVTYSFNEIEGGSRGVFLAEILAWMAAMLLLMVSFIICFRKLRKT